MRKNRSVAAAVLLSLALGLSGCSLPNRADAPASETAEQAGSQKKASPFTTQEITEKNVAEVAEALKQAGLDKDGVFPDWVQAYWDDAKGRKKRAADAAGEYVKADCRMTAMTLLGDMIKSARTDAQYTGDYLMFDLEAIDTSDTYAALRPRRNLFTTLFGEFGYPDNRFAQAFGEHWSEYGFHVESDTAALVSVVFKAIGEDKAFVGHAGVLLKRPDGTFLLVEKISFDDPFTVTKLDRADQLVELMASREDYTVEEGEPEPAVYLNGQLLDQLH